MQQARRITDYDLQAAVDNELSWEDHKKVLQSINKKPSLKRRYEELLKQKKLLMDWWAHENKKHEDNIRERNIQ